MTLKRVRLGPAKCAARKGWPVTDEEFADELLAPPSDVAAEDQPVMDDPAAAVPDQWHPSHGFADHRMAVRVWVDEDSRQLTRIHVSPRWRDILGPHRSLEDAFLEAFLAASIRSGADPLDTTEPAIATARAEGELGWADLEDVTETILALVEKQADLGARAPEDVRWATHEGEQTVVRRGPVTLTLSLAGLAESVRFDRTWQHAATADQIAAAVLKTARSAYADYTPPVLIPGEHEELAEEFFQAQRDLLTIMEKGSR